MKKIIITASIIFFFAASVNAQKQMFGIGWQINFPQNTDYLTKTSFAGGRLEYRHFLKYKNVTVGGGMDWSTYEQYLPRQTFTKPDGSAITSDYVAQIYQLPLYVNAHFYMEAGKHFQPFAGIALGGQYLEQSLYYNVYVTDDNNWGFVARPELGTIVKIDQHQDWGFIVSAQYSYSTNKTDLLNSNSFKNFGIGVGVVFEH
jgi:hypothetical protein